jgi:hypothetical protein
MHGPGRHRQSGTRMTGSRLLPFHTVHTLVFRSWSYSHRVFSQIHLFGFRGSARILPLLHASFLLRSTGFHGSITSRWCGIPQHVSLSSAIWVRLYRQVSRVWVRTRESCRFPVGRKKGDRRRLSAGPLPVREGGEYAGDRNESR